VDDVRIGRIARELRRRNGWRQVDVARRANCHQTTISRLERGHLSTLSLGLLRGIFAALGASFDGLVRWRAGELDRLLDQRHASILDLTARELIGWRWLVHPEVTYSEFGERGSIDLLAVRPEERAVAVIEVKGDVTTVEGTIRKHAEKTRLVSTIVLRLFGWRPSVVGRILVLPEESTARRAIDRHETTFRAAYPATSRDVRAWLRSPSGSISGIWFLSVKHRGVGRRVAGGPKRVRRPSPSGE
jgi:transcriptional regulator with XRE-family HTH domain